MKLRTPDHITITDGYGAFLPQDDISVGVSLTERGTLEVKLTADKTPVGYLRLRWNFSEEEVRRDLVRVYGDVWERSY